ncbi:B-cell antigen receptor complex-associated protein alpha chain, partial [Calypte anna]|uniref:B-cell antigen receptor complex-associated protein alpha chain n=1 Tax=Calypte anna TaxID=9244 RepID=UPI0011C39F21
PILTLLSRGDDTKNRIIQTQGVLLLLCVGGPGLLLLFRKRWANEQREQSKKSESEEERIYEGLDLAECSMYEDISRGGGHPPARTWGPCWSPPWRNHGGTLMWGPLPPWGPRI